MKKIKFLVIIISSILLINLQIQAQNIGIGTSAFNPDSSALVEMRGNKGLLIPRMTTAQRDSISNPSQSLLIFNTTTKCYEGYVDNAWHAIWCGCSGVNVTASASATAICNGQTSILTASGATSYSWNTGGNTASITVSPTSTTTYIVTGTSSGCTGTATVSVTVNSLPTAVTVSGGGTSCGSATLTASGGTGGTIYWQGTTSGGTSTVSS